MAQAYGISVGRPESVGMKCNSVFRMLAVRFCFALVRLSLFLAKAQEYMLATLYFKPAVHGQ